MDAAVLQACHIKVSQQLILFAGLINYFIISTTTILVVGVLDNVLQTFSFLYDLFRACPIYVQERSCVQLVQILLYIRIRQYPSGLIFYQVQYNILILYISSVELNWN
jgi:hypothetical protein